MNMNNQFPMTNQWGMNCICKNKEVNSTEELYDFIESFIRFSYIFLFYVYI